jgi:hypothetical protein
VFKTLVEIDGRRALANVSVVAQLDLRAFRGKRAADVRPGDGRAVDRIRAGTKSARSGSGGSATQRRSSNETSHVSARRRRLELEPRDLVRLTELQVRPIGGLPVDRSALFRRESDDAARPFPG